MNPDLTILLPAHNEADVIGRLLDEIKQEVATPHVVLVCDNLSTDTTARVAAEGGATVVHGPLIGKGNAVRSALPHITTPYVVMMNADYTYSATYVDLIYELLRGSNDVVVGYRSLVESGSMTHTNSIGNWLLSMIASMLYRKRIYDLCSGMWGFRKEALDKFTLTSSGFSLEADLFTNLVKNGCKLEQIPISYRRRMGGAPKLHVLDGLKIGLFLLRRRF